MRTIACILAVSMLVPLAAQTRQGADAPAPLSLPVTSVALYKSGVAYFEHRGNVTGDQSLTVQFTAAQLDDVLKSLTTVDLGGGRVVGVTYDSPTPVERRLQGLNLPLGQRPTTLDVLGALGGARVQVRTGSGALYSGRLLNTQRRTRTDRGSASEIDEVTLVTDQGDILTLELESGGSVRVLDADLRRDLGAYLDVAASVRGSDARRLVIGTAGAGVRPFVVSYLSEAAVWKSTFRLVFPDDEDAKPVLQGWAIVDNVSAGDWRNVELSLIAGAPQSFVQPLSRPLFARRPAVALST
jgi:hypothetical protein